jgi:aerobic-type carbon monoxide dehydrogenase small subunit (CoxS/CutS family)
MISAKVRKQVRAIYVFQCGYRPAMIRHRLLLLSEQQRHAESREIRRLIENIDSRLRQLEERRILKKRNKD